MFILFLVTVGILSLLMQSALATWNLPERARHGKFQEILQAKQKQNVKGYVGASIPLYFDQLQNHFSECAQCNSTYFKQ